MIKQGESISVIRHANKPAAIDIDDTRPTMAPHSAATWNFPMATNNVFLTVKVY